MALPRVALLALASLMLFHLSSAVPDCSGLPQYVSSTDCNKYADNNAADVAVDRLRLSEFGEDDKEMFRTVLANVSNKYYPSIRIQPENIAIVELFEDREGLLMLSFFVMNPTGSDAFPILFRTTELTLMMELNLAFINGHLGYTIEPQPIEDTYPLFFPVWAIVLIVYFLLVVMGYLIYLATKNWNEGKSDSIDIDVESTDAGGAVLINKSYTSYDQNDYSVVHRKRSRTNSSLNNNITEVDSKVEVEDKSLQTPRTVAMQVRASDIDDKTTEATIEKEPGEGSADGRSDSTSEAGEVNEAYDGGDSTTAF